MLLRNALFFLSFVTLMACHSQAWKSQTKGSPSGSALSKLSFIENAQFFASLSEAVYCGEGSDCEVMNSYESHRKFFGLPIELEGWEIAFVSARDGVKDVEGYVFYHPDQEDVFLAFRGSESLEQAGGLQDWLSTNARVFPAYYGGAHFKGTLHQGFLEAMYGVWHPNETGLLKVLNEKKLWNKRFYLTGHSLGGALATLIGMRLKEEGQDVAGIYTFGAPRLSYWDFQGSFNESLKSKTHNFVQPKDPVPRILLTFVGVGQTWALEGDGATLVDKDGIGTWDLLTALAFGDPMSHSLNERVGQGYLQALKRLKHVAKPEAEPNTPSVPPGRMEPEEGTYVLINQHSGKCLNLNVAVLDQTGFDNFEKIQQYDCPEANAPAWPNSFWELKKEGEQQYRLESSYSHKCVDLDTGRGGRNNGDKIQQYDCLQRTEMRNRNWYFVSSGTPDVYFLESAWSGKCLETSVSNPATDGFANSQGLQQWQCRVRPYQKNQLWRLEKRP